MSVHIPVPENCTDWVVANLREDDELVYGSYLPHNTPSVMQVWIKRGDNCFGLVHPDGFTHGDERYRATLVVDKTDSDLRDWLLAAEA